MATRSIGAARNKYENDSLEKEHLLISTIEASEMIRRGFGMLTTYILVTLARDQPILT